MLALLLALLPAADLTLTSTADAAPPKELAKDIRELLIPTAHAVGEGKGAAKLTLWFRKDVPAEATKAQVENGLTLAEVPISTILGVVRFEEAFTDYRKQKISPGVYVLRYAKQPPTGDHMGTAPTDDFVLLCPAADDRKAATMDGKDLVDLATKSAEDHPGVMVLFAAKGAKTVPALAVPAKGHTTMTVRLGASCPAGRGAVEIGVTVAGVSPKR